MILGPPGPFTLYSSSLAYPRQIPAPGRVRPTCIFTLAAPGTHLAAELDRWLASSSTSTGGTVRCSRPVDMDRDLRGNPLAHQDPGVAVRICTGGTGPDNRRRIGRPSLVIQGIEITRPGGGAEIIRRYECRKEHRSGKHDWTGDRPFCRRAGSGHQLDVPSILALNQPDHRVGPRGHISESRIVRIGHLVRPSRTDDTDHRISCIY